MVFLSEIKRATNSLPFFLPEKNDLLPIFEFGEHVTIVFSGVIRHYICLGLEFERTARFCNDILEPNLSCIKQNGEIKCPVESNLEAMSNKVLSRDMREETSFSMEIDCSFSNTPVYDYIN